MSTGRYYSDWLQTIRNMLKVSRGCSIAAALVLASMRPLGLPAQVIADRPPTDTSPHRILWVNVDGVRISYLEWGGEGLALLFVPGFGNSAHVFDEFAPRFRRQPPRPRRDPRGGSANPISPSKKATTSPHVSVTLVRR